MGTYNEAEMIAMEMAGVKKDELIYFKNSVLTYLASKKRGDATELIVKEFLKENKIYTTRDDEKSEIWIYKEGIYVPQGKTYITEYCRKILEEVYNHHLCNEVIAKIEADTYIDADKFFIQNNIYEIAVINGILNINTKSLTDFTSDKIFFNKLPITYDPTKTCPNIIKHFEEVLKNKEDLPVMLEIFGFLLLKEYRFEKAFMFLGDGRNGKGKTLELMKRFLGIDNCANIPLQQFEEDIFSLGELFNKMANLGGDIDKRALKHTGNFKTLTGRDLISASRKFLPRVNFTNYAKMIFCANALPITYDLTIAFFNRWILLEFPYTFLSIEEIETYPLDDRKNLKIRDADIISKLSNPDELSGLLNLALESLCNLLKKGDFSYSKNTEEIRMTWLRKSDSFNAFILDCIVEDDELKLLKKDLRKAYNDYCKLHKLKPSNDKIIRNILFETLALSEIKVDNKWFWEGIALKNEDIGKPSKASNGFHSLVQSESSHIAEKMVTSLTSPTKSGFEAFEKPQMFRFLAEYSLMAKNNEVIPFKIGDLVSSKEFEDLAMLCEAGILSLIEPPKPMPATASPPKLPAIEIQTPKKTTEEEDKAKFLKELKAFGF